MRDDTKTLNESSDFSPSISSVEVSPVSPSVSLVSGKGVSISDGCGPSSAESFAYYDQDTSSWKTYQACFLQGWEPFSETWPRSGMTRNGRLYRLPTQEHLTSETEYGLWPTPCASDISNRQPPTRPHVTKNGTIRHIGESGEQSQIRLSQAVKMWPTPRAIYGEHPGMKDPRHLTGAVQMLPTPTARDYRSGMSREALLRREALSSRGVNLSEHVQRMEDNNGKLNPAWVEWLMGFPIGWTALNLWETHSCHKSQSGSAKGSSKRKKE